MGIFDRYEAFHLRYGTLDKRAQRAVLFAAWNRIRGFADTRGQVLGRDWAPYAAEGGPSLAHAHQLTDKELLAVRNVGDATVRRVREWLALHPPPPAAAPPHWLSEE
jgi:hypothetical protein